jgi:hypothetical protein
MPDDPFAVLENAVAAVEQAATRLASLGDEPGAPGNSAATPSGGPDGSADATGAPDTSAPENPDRLAQLEDERRAVRDRLRRIRDRLAEISVSLPEEPPS